MVGFADTPGLALALCLALACAARPTRADSRLGPEQSPIRTSRYTVDLYEGPVLGGTRSSALAGSYVALAEDVDGSLQNPAAPAARPPHSLHHFDYGLSLGITYPFAVRDLFNAGNVNRRTYEDTDFIFVAPSLNFQFGRLGLGLNVRGQSYRLDSSGDERFGANEQLRAQFFKIEPQIAYQFVDGQLILGAGGRIFLQRVISGQDALINNRRLLTTSGFGVEAGMIWRPNGQRYRVGAAFRSSIESKPELSPEILVTPSGDWVIRDDFFLPRSISLPWELDLGLAYQFGPRPFNSRWLVVDEIIAPQVREFETRRRQRQEALFQRSVHLHAEGAADIDAQLGALQRESEEQQARDDRVLESIREQAWRRLRSEFRRWERRFLMLSASVLVSGAVYEAVGLEAFLLQRVQRSGDYLVVSPRLGVEAEVWPDRLKARVGTYLEPSRFDGGATRAHATLGVEVKLFDWDVFDLWPDDYIWQVSGAVDLARDYFVWSLGIGGWY